MAESTVEGVVSIIADLQEPVLHPKRVAEVVVEIMAGDLDVPAFQISSVEELDPILPVGRRLGAGTGSARQQHSDRDKKGSTVWHHAFGAAGLAA